MAKEVYLGVGNQARKVKKAYIGVGGQARLFWEYWQKPYPKFSYTGDWRWYQDDETTGIIEVYSSGTMTFLDGTEALYDGMDVCLIGGGGGSGAITSGGVGLHAGGGAGAYMETVSGIPLGAGTVEITVGARGASGSTGGASSIAYNGQTFSAQGGGGGGSAMSGDGDGGRGGSGGGGGARTANYESSRTGGDGGSNGSAGESSVGNPAAYGGAGGLGDGKGKYLFGDVYKDLYCGGGGGGGPTRGAGGGGGGGAGGAAGSKYGAGGGGATASGGQTSGGASGYQGAVFFKFSRRLLPAGYQQVEYLKAASAGPYVVMPITTQEGLSLEFDCIPYTGADSCYIGCTISTGRRQYFRFDRYQPGAIVYGRGYTYCAATDLATTEIGVSSVDDDNLNHVVVRFGDYTGNRSAGCTWFGYTATGTRTDALSAVGDPMYLFGNTASGERGTFGKVAAYNASDSLIMFLIPCKRTSDNVLGYYDAVSKTFLTNVGTGSFTAGPNI